MGVYSSTPLTDAQRTTYETRLTEAEEALHKLALGQSARVFVDQNGERVEFNLNSMAQLRAYVLHLKSVLGKPLGITGPAAPWVL